MFFEQCVMEAGTSAIIQDPKLMIWRKGEGGGGGLVNQ